MFSRLVIILAALSASACNQADASICKPLFDQGASTSLPKNVAREFYRANDCVRREAYKLGIAEGPPSDVANAAISACSDALELYVLTAADTGLIKDYETNEALEAERKEFAKLARSYVIQTRAGHCKSILESQ